MQYYYDGQTGVCLCILGHAFALHTTELLGCHFNSVHDRTQGRRQCVAGFEAETWAWHNISPLINKMLMEALLILWTVHGEQILSWFRVSEWCHRCRDRFESLQDYFLALILQHHIINTMCNKFRRLCTQIIIAWYRHLQRNSKC
jgi:hypothetical protein